MRGSNWIKDVPPDGVFTSFHPRQAWKPHSDDCTQCSHTTAIRTHTRSTGQKNPEFGLLQDHKHAAQATMCTAPLCTKHHSNRRHTTHSCIYHKPAPCCMLASIVDSPSPPRKNHTKNEDDHRLVKSRIVEKPEAHMAARPPTFAEQKHTDALNRCVCVFAPTVAVEQKGVQSSATY